MGRYLTTLLSIKIIILMLSYFNACEDTTFGETESRRLRLNVHLSFFRNISECIGVVFGSTRLYSSRPKVIGLNKHVCFPPEKLGTNFPIMFKMLPPHEH